MTGRVETAGGKVYELPALLEWRLRRTGGVPCDSFRARCLYSAEMGEVLKAACRFAATENGVTRFRGVIDEWSAVCGAEVTAVNRAKKLRQTVRNEAFLARGGSCRRVVYVPSRSVNELRYTGRYQIEKSAEDARELTVTLAGSVDAEPMDRVELSLARLGVRGTFRSRRRAGMRGGQKTASACWSSRAARSARSGMWPVRWTPRGSRTI